MWPSGLSVPCGPPQPGSMFKGAHPVFLGGKGAQMHLRWELLLVCAVWSTELLLYAIREDQGGNRGAEEQGQPGERKGHFVRAKGWLVWKGS